MVLVKRLNISDPICTVVPGAIWSALEPTLGINNRPERSHRTELKIILLHQELKGKVFLTTIGLAVAIDGS
ncbi:MAG: hypothetical protein MMC33_004607 [Icmadophila ericetorum]|nr:hypothetical protein [Icmadophila ericetorum]